MRSLFFCIGFILFVLRLILRSFFGPLYLHFWFIRFNVYACTKLTFLSELWKWLQGYVSKYKKYALQVSPSRKSCPNVVKKTGICYGQVVCSCLLLFGAYFYNKYCYHVVGLFVTYLSV